MQTAMSPIALRGFVLGYMSKTAENDIELGPGAGVADGDDPLDGGGTGGNIENQTHSNSTENMAPDSTRTYAGGEVGDMGAMSSRHNMKEMLMKLLPGAGIGAVGGAAGSALMDTQQGNPVNMRRMALVAALMAPAGMVGQMAMGSAGFGKGPTLGEFGRGASDLAGQGVGVAKAGYKSGINKIKGAGSSMKADLTA